MNGPLEELILKARFEEAKGRELAEESAKGPTTKEQGSNPKYSPRKAPVTEATQPSTPPASTKQDAPSTSIGMSKGIRGKCFGRGTCLQIALIGRQRDKERKRTDDEKEQCLP